MRNKLMLGFILLEMGMSNVFATEEIQYTANLGPEDRCTPSPGEYCEREKRHNSTTNSQGD